ncbi:MAG: GTP cyclohydrolase I FolE2 [Gammaproteobacteria bacterium]|nr:MAG: GTP cyclohydrolase I FolE2 [Gammaproteobacteria bacterium]
MITNKPKLKDMQNDNDIRNISINQVGIKDIQHPIIIIDKDNKKCYTVSSSTLSVYLDESKKGTHMSRFVELINERQLEISIKNFKKFMQSMLSRLSSDKGKASFSFKYFISKKAPISKISSFLDYNISLVGEQTDDDFILNLKVAIPVTSLCPCSKEISKYGAHNQRSQVTITATIDDNIFIEDIIIMIEKQASCDLYSTLKREDEKYVTEKAYDNPKFVEDIIRDIAIDLNKNQNIKSYKLEVENYESIHNHSAYALIQKN